MDNYFYPGILNFNIKLFEYNSTNRLNYPRIYYNSKLTNVRESSDDVKSLDTSDIKDHVVYGDSATPLYYYFHNDEILQPKQKINEIDASNYPESWLNNNVSLEMFFDPTKPDANVRWTDIDTHFGDWKWRIAQDPEEKTTDVFLSSEIDFRGVHFKDDNIRESPKTFRPISDYPGEAKACPNTLSRNWGLPPLYQEAVQYVFQSADKKKSRFWSKYESSGNVCKM